MNLRDTERGIRIFNHFVVGFILCVVAIFIWPIMSNMKESVQNSNYLSITAVDTIGTVNTMFGNAKDHKDGTVFGLLYKFGLLADRGVVLADAGTGTLNAATGTLKAATGTIGAAGDMIKHADGEITKAAAMLPETKAKIDKVLDAYETLPGHLNKTLDATTTTIFSINKFFIDPETFRLRTNVADLAGSGSDFLDRGGLFVTHADNAIFPVYHGHHPKWNETKNISLGLLGLSTKTSQTLYYGVGAWKGQ